MFAKQLTVFVENKLGSLSKVLGVLKENNVNILSMSLADTTEFGLLRLIVTNAAIGQEKLSERGYSALLSDVSIITVSHEVGSLQNLLEAINENNKLKEIACYGKALYVLTLLSVTDHKARGLE